MTTPSFRFRVDISEVAAQLNTTRELIEDKVVSGVETLSIAAHAYIKRLADEKWADDDFKRQYYLGIGKYGAEAGGSSTKDDRIDQTVKNLRWVKVADGIWVVELDEKARFLEEGRESVFMSWLLKPGDKGVKRSKDGSYYRAIPFKQTQGKADAPGAKPGFAELIRKQAKRQNISLTKIEKDTSGNPKLGVLHKLNMKPTMSIKESPSLFSKPRSLEDAIQFGLKPHSGIYKLQGAVVTQREQRNAKGEIKKDKHGKTIVKKETVVFRTISSKHKEEGRWYAPKIEAFNGLGQAYQWAEKQWDNIVKQIEQDLGRM